MYEKNMNNGPKMELKSIKNRSKNRCEKKNGFFTPPGPERSLAANGRGTHKFNKIDNKLTEEKQIIGLPAD